MTETTWLSIYAPVKDYYNQFCNISLSCLQRRARQGRLCGKYDRWMDKDKGRKEAI